MHFIVEKQPEYDCTDVATVKIPLITCLLHWHCTVVSAALLGSTWKFLKVIAFVYEGWVDIHCAFPCCTPHMCRGLTLFHCVFLNVLFNARISILFFTIVQIYSHFLMFTPPFTMLCKSFFVALNLSASHNLYRMNMYAHTWTGAQPHTHTDTHTYTHTHTHTHTHRAMFIQPSSGFREVWGQNWQGPFTQPGLVASS